ncbi:hypothetical protein PsYK624_034180 [Phanerochaete sordida]|uniref:Uncharacterized protein n=1 Tax=Phanerochaete sordida TaxID=48140 RepID=A0A9P3G3S1_9APHY|nr:hypothetical protein PsYK624_034180 [Phanerochaete sordida]
MIATRGAPAASNLHPGRSFTRTSRFRQLKVYIQRNLCSENAFLKAKTRTSATIGGTGTTALSPANGSIDYTTN